MKLACATDDGRSIAAHFGHCDGFLVLEVEDGKVSHREVRRAAGSCGDGKGEHGHGERNCHGKTEHGHQDRMAMLADCEAVICLGMGPRAVAALESSGIRALILSEPMDPEAAALAYYRGDLATRSTTGECCHHD